MVTDRHYATEDKTARFSSLERINIISGYVTCCYGDGLPVFFTERTEDDSEDSSVKECGERLTVTIERSVTPHATRESLSMKH